MNLIYALQDPVTFQIRYVGKSTSGLKRPNSHLLRCYYESKRMFHFPVYRWIRKLSRSGLQPKIVVVQEFTSVNDLNGAEIYWISYFKAVGSPLLNSTRGGDGNVGYRFSEESKARMSQARRGRKVSAETVAKMKANWHLYRANQNKEDFNQKVRAGTKLWWETNKDRMLATVKNNFKGSAGANKIAIVDQHGTEYPSKTHAAAAIGCTVGAVTMAMKAGRMCKGFQFRKVV